MITRVSEVADYCMFLEIEENLAELVPLIFKFINSIIYIFSSCFLTLHKLDNMHSTPCTISASSKQHYTPKPLQRCARTRAMLVYTRAARTDSAPHYKVMRSVCQSTE